MKQYRLTPAARQDLSEIWDVTAERWDVDQAERYLGEIRAAVERLAEDPGRGRPCDDLRPGYRRYGIGSHLLFFVVTGSSADVIRVLHQRMDPTRHL